MENKNHNYSLTDKLFQFLDVLWIMLQEIIGGIINNRVPASFCFPGIFLGAAFYFRLDNDLFHLFWPKYHLFPFLRSVLIYTFLLSGWLIWGLCRAGVRIQLLTKLKIAFGEANLKCNNTLPSLIEDLEVDAHVRKLRLKTNGVPKSSFEKGTELLEAVLNMTIVRILQSEDDKSKIEILYAMKDLEKNVPLENPDQFTNAEIPIGITHGGSIHVNMRDVGHILVAGQTGGGKSNFLKIATTVLTKNNPKAKVIFLDFKGGMESADLRNHAENLGSNISCFEGTKACIEELDRIGIGLEARFKSLTDIGASNFDDYLKKKNGQSNTSKETMRTSTEKRTFIIVDEIAQLYSREPGIDKEMIVKAKAAVNRVARQGRAAGVHLIIATQKPDTSSFDQTVKANLPAILCFPMANQSSSVSAIGTKRAFELNPNIKGRAIWKYGPRLEEVQTYYFG